jgi:hypothetical protein
MRLYKLNIFLLCLFVGACTSTKVADVRYERGKLLKSEKTPEVLDSTDFELVINKDSIALNEKFIYKHTDIKIYEKIKSTSLQTEGTTMTDNPFWAIIGTPGALFLDVMTLGMMGATAEIWTKDSNEWKTIKDKLADDFFVDEKDMYTTKKLPMVNQTVQLFINNQPTQAVSTDSKGHASYSFANALYDSKVQPSELIKNQGVTVSAQYQGKQGTQKFSNKEVPESYFARKFEDMKPLLSQRAGRFGNCEFIAKNKREFFECYYE